MMRPTPGLLRALLWSLIAGCLANTSSSALAEGLKLEKGDHICIIGNTLAERMQHYGGLESRIVLAHPELDLTFRNLGYSGDEIELNKRLRSRDFGTPDQWLAGQAPVPQPEKLSPRDEVAENRFELTNTKADVVFAFFGYNESFAGEAGLPQFKQNLQNFIRHTLGQKYNGRTAPRLVIFSPIAHEYLDDPNLPGREAVDAANARLGAYARAMGEVAGAEGVLFVDLFTPTLERFNRRNPGVRHTLNGVHPIAAGDDAVAEIAMDALFPHWRQKVGAAAEQVAQLERVRDAVNDKNWHWFHRYRTTDGYSTYGDRAFLKFAEGAGGYGAGRSNYGTVQRELEVLDQQTANRDRRVWAVAKGSDLKVDDQNLPPFFEVISNKPGPHVMLSGEQAIEKMKPGAGLKVQLFASEDQFPELVNPVQMSFDTRGRLWVATWQSYPHWKPTEPMSDKLLIFEDTSGDGRADVCKVFAGDLHNPTGFEFWNGGVIVAQGPDIWFLKDTTGDDQCDVRERLVHGLDTADTHHTANSFVLDPGGALYFQEGTFHHSQVETPWGPPRRVANGAVFRYEPRSQKFDVYVSFGFANPHGHVFDRWGQDFVYDGTGAQPYHAVLFSGDTDFPHKHARPPQVYQQRTRPCSGVEILSSSHFPEEFQGNLLVNNVIGFLGILRYKLQDKDSSFTAVEVEPIVFSEDPNFRPADVEIGPDGAIWFTDWHNPIIGHMQHNLRDPSRDKAHGRVYRVVHEGRELLKSQDLTKLSIPQLLDNLKSPDDRLRYRTRIELGSRPTSDVLTAAERWLASFDPQNAEHQHHLLEGLWLYQNHNVVNEPLLRKLLESPEPRARAAAIRVLVAWRDRVSGPIDLLQVAVNDEHPRVRLWGVWGLSYFHGEDAAKAAEVAVESLIYPQDDYLKYMLDETTKTLDRRMKAAR